MKKNEIIRLGKTLGLDFDYRTWYSNDLDMDDFVVFNGVNGQRFSIDGKKMNDDQILREMGCALKLMGRRQLKVELHTLLNIISDN